MKFLASISDSSSNIADLDNVLHIDFKALIYCMLIIMYVLFVFYEKHLRQRNSSSKNEHESVIIYWPICGIQKETV